MAMEAMEELLLTRVGGRGSDRARRPSSRQHDKAERRRWVTHGVGGPARARWQDGGGVGAASARAAHDGGRASAGGEQQPAGSMVGWSGGAGRALLAGPCGLAGRTVVGSGWRRHVLRARAGGQRRVNLTKHAVLAAAWCGTA